MKKLVLSLFLGLLWTCAPPPKYVPRPPRLRPPARTVLVRTHYFGTLEACLKALGIPYVELPPEAISVDTLRTFRLVVVPYLPEPSQAISEALAEFVEEGGKLLLFYSLPDTLAHVLGIRKVMYLRREYPGQFSEMRFVKGLPERVRQPSWNIFVVEPDSPDAEVLAKWYDSKGKDTGYPAVVCSPSGCYVSHVLLEGGLEERALMLAGIVGRLLPDLRPVMAVGALERVGKVGEFSNLEEMWRKAGGGSGPLKEARKLRAKAIEEMGRRSYFRALHLALKARRKAVEAYAEMQPSREGELRAVWVHTAFGVSDWGWKKTAEVLSKYGFNAIFANMLWGGAAYYPSEVLPVVGRRDLMAEAVNWCHRYGLEFHVWMVNNYLGSGTPEDFLEKLRAEGRLQKDKDGKELPWLCPSDPRNRAMEREALLEVVRRYPVDGVHLDYIRYPGASACYCDGCRERFQRDTGIKVKDWPEEVISGPYFADFQRWRREQVTKLVEEISREVRRIRPDVKISAAVFPDWRSARFQVGQDWKLWVERGYLDFVCPMDYTTDPEKFGEWVRMQSVWTEGRIPLYPGIGAYRMTDGGEVLHQVALARELGADGFVIFSYTVRTAQDFFPLLRRGATRKRTSPPHRWDWASFEVPEGLGGHRYSQGGPVHVRVALDRLPKWARKFRAEVVLEKTDGEAKRLGVLKPGSPSISTTLEPEPGTYRIAVRGWAKKGWWRKERFVSRSPVIRVLTPQEVAEEFPCLGPRPEGGVGVYVEGLGGRAILEALREEGLPAFPVCELSEDVLSSCRVLVLAQPKDVLVWDMETRGRIKRWVEEGGGLLVTHDAVGYGFLAPIFPEVARGEGRPEGRRWRAAGDHPLCEDLDKINWHPHRYHDHVTLKLGPEGIVLAVDEGMEPVVAAGTPGRGRYVACGLALGLGTDDKDELPEDQERELLVSSVRWLMGDGR